MRASFVTPLLIAGVLAVPAPVPNPLETLETIEILDKRAVPVGVAIKRCTVANTIALTFDDGPYIYTENVLSQLKTAKMKATFFVNGQNWASIYDYQPTIKKMVAEGHQVASHTWSHPDLSTLSDAAIRSQMTQLETAFLNILGKFPTYMRPPYFGYNSATLSTLGSLGYKVIDANIDTVDWDLQANINQAVTNFRNGVNAGGNLALMHDVHQNTVTGLLPQVINIVKQKGLKAVTVGECLGDAAANWYRGARGGTTPPPSNDPTLPVSPDGRCGAAAGFRCPSGTCCSQYNWCGVEAGHCGTGCQIKYGVCS